MSTLQQRYRAITISWTSKLVYLELAGELGTSVDGAETLLVLLEVLVLGVVTDGGETVHDDWLQDCDAEL